MLIVNLTRYSFHPLKTLPMSFCGYFFSFLFIFNAPNVQDWMDLFGDRLIFNLVLSTFLLDSLLPFNISLSTFLRHWLNLIFFSSSSWIRGKRWWLKRFIKKSTKLIKTNPVFKSKMPKVIRTSKISSTLNRNVKMIYS